MRVLVIGTGKVGRAIVRKLGADGRFEVVALDAQPPPTLQGATTTHQIDVADPEILTALLATGDVVVSACPHYLNPGIARAARAAGCHYFDLTESVASTSAVRECADGAATAFVPQCGIAPGYVCVLAHDIATRFDAVERLSLRAGCVPVNPVNRLKYNAMWSMDGVVHEYCEPCVALRDGRQVSLSPLEDREDLVIGGIAFEAFNTSGGLGTLPQTYQGRLQSLDYKSIRYPGHAELMRFLLEDLRFRERRQELRDLLAHNLPTTHQDLIALQVVAIGQRRGAREQVTASQIFRHRDEDGGTAIEDTTASAICVMVDLLVQGRLPRHGFVRQEDVTLADFLASPFAAVYRDTPWC